MRGVLANTVMAVALVAPLCLYAQPRGGGHGSFSGSRGSYRTYAPARLHPMLRQATPAGSSYRKLSIAPVTGSSLISSGQTSCILNPSYSNSPYCRQYFSGRPGYGVEPVYPYWMPSGEVNTSEAAPPAIEPQQDSQLADQVGNLSAEVEMMRQDQALRDRRPAAAVPVAPEPNPPKVVLAFRDGHRVEVQNYAIVGNTLWVISDDTTRRVALSDLDLPQTQRVNGDRGVDFAIPDSQ